MKFSLRLGDSQTLSRADAWACCTSNLAFPGSGSLLAGRWIGYPQVALTLAALTLTTWHGVRFFVWAWQHWSLLVSGDDPAEALMGLWLAARWPLFGMALFVIAWIWALLTSLSVMNRARREELLREQPPIIGKQF